MILRAVDLISMVTRYVSGALHFTQFSQGISLLTRRVTNSSLQLVAAR